jgi:hypothetical protein
MKKLFITGVVAASLALSPATSFAGLGVVMAGKTFGAGATGWVWGVFGCSGGIILAAMAANWQQNRQLTWNEAATCGILFWVNPAKRK